MVLDPIPQPLPVHFFGSRPQPPTSPCERQCTKVKENGERGQIWKEAMQKGERQSRELIGLVCFLNFVDIHAAILSTFTHTQTHTHANTHTHKHTHTQTQTYTYTHAHHYLHLQSLYNGKDIRITAKTHAYPHI